MGDFDKHLSEAKADQAVLVDFYATWCGPCEKIKPFLSDLSDQHPDVVFLKGDIDKVSTLATRENVMTLPTFKTFKNKQEVYCFTGADQERIQNVVENKGECTLPAQSNVNWTRVSMFAMFVIYVLIKSGYMDQILTFIRSLLHGNYLPLPLTVIAILTFE